MARQASSWPKSVRTCYIFKMFQSFFKNKKSASVEFSNLQAVLFDLDGTLIDVDMDRFVPLYLRRLTARMSDLAEPSKTTAVLHRAVVEMFANTDHEKTLETILHDALQTELLISAEHYNERLELFCQEDLNDLQPLVKEHPLSRQLIEACLERGLQVVVATNPIFPRTVVDARLTWGKLDDLPFQLVTAYETSHFCKPNPAYFDEVLAQLQVPAEACLMVGNDTQHDTAASLVGIRTCLLTPWRIDRPGERFKADWEGRHEELLPLLQAPGNTMA